MLRACQLLVRDIRHVDLLTVQDPFLWACLACSPKGRPQMLFAGPVNAMQFRLQSFCDSVFF